MPGPGGMPEGPVTQAGLVELARRLQERCLAGQVTLAAAESCTGGLVAHLITEVPGSSAYFRGALVSYADELKEQLLGVPAETLARHGAVSAQTAVAMAEGTRSRLGCDVGLAVTGIAGPSGGSPEKPVGLTYVAVADAIGHEVRRFVWTGDRSGNKLASAQAALELALERLGERPGERPGERGA
jgi:PncC family amidohydrolase